MRHAIMRASIDVGFDADILEKQGAIDRIDEDDRIPLNFPREQLL